METTRKLSRREKLSLIGKYLRPCWGHFAAALLCACLAMVFNALTPQIIRLTVDSILGPETPKLPGFLMSWLNWAALEAQPLRALWWAAAAVLLTAYFMIWMPPLTWETRGTSCCMAGSMWITT